MTALIQNWQFSGGEKEKRCTGGQCLEVCGGSQLGEGEPSVFGFTCVGHSGFTSGQQKLVKQFKIELVFVLENPIKSGSYVLHLSKEGTSAANFAQDVR